MFRWRQALSKEVVYKPSEYRPTMSAEIPVERTYQRTCTDSNQSVQSPTPIPPTSGISGVEHHGDRLDPLAFQGEPMVGKTHPYISSLLSSDDAIPIGQYRPTPANLDADAFQTENQTILQVSITFLYYTKSQWLKEKSTTNHTVKTAIFSYL